MSFDGNGNYTVPSGTAAVAGDVIDATKFNTFLTDLQIAMSLMLCRDGQSAVGTDIPMGGNKFTGLSAGSAAGDSVAYDQMSAFIWTLLDDTNAAAARTTLGATTVGSALFTAASANAAAKVLGVKEIAYWNILTNFAFSAAAFSSIPSGAVAATVDTGGVTSTTVYTVPRDGYARIQVGQIQCVLFSGTVNFVELRVHQNATNMNPSHYAHPGTDLWSSMNVILPVTAGDTLEVYAKVDGGGTANLTLIGVSIEMI